MKKLLLLLPLTTLFALPAQAITWDEFWRPFVNGRPYYGPYYSVPYIPMCDQRVVREEYVPGTYWSQGYIRRWTDIVRVPCYE